MPQYQQYTEIAQNFDILYCELRLEPVYDQVQIYPDCWALLTWIRRTCNSEGLFKASAHSFKQSSSRLLKSTFSLSLCTYITRMDVMLDFICMWPVDLTGARRKRQNTKWKIPCPQWDSNPQPFDSKSDALPTELAGLGECCPFKWPYYMHVLPIPMFTLLYLPEWWSRA